MEISIENLQTQYRAYNGCFKIILGLRELEFMINQIEVNCIYYHNVFISKETVSLIDCAFI